MFQLRATTLAIAFSLATYTQALSVLVPAYIWPGDPGVCAGWAPITAAANAHTSTTFYIVINPASGPGDGGVGSVPDPAYSSCIPTIKLANTVVIGYVATGGGVSPDRPLSLIEQHVSTYAAWGAAYRPTGIFFDEAANTASLVSTYSTYTSFARSQGFSFIILNPGTPAAAGYYPLADLIVTLEDNFVNYSASTLNITASTPAAKQAVLLHDAPAAPPTTIIAQLKTLGIKAFYSTDDLLVPNPWDTLPTQWTTLVNDIAA